MLENLIVLLIAVASARGAKAPLPKDFAEKCAQAGGTFQSSSCFCAPLGKSISPYDRDDTFDCMRASMEPIVDELTGIIHVNEKCVDYWNDGDGTCPNFLIGKAMADRKDKCLVDSILCYMNSPNKMCRSAVPAISLKTPEELESGLARNTQTGIRMKPGFLSSSACTGRKWSIHQGPRAKPKEDRFSETEQKIIIAEYYANMNRLESASLTTIESIAAIDHLLGEAPLHGEVCGDPRLPRTVELCDRAKTCGAGPQGLYEARAKAIAEDALPQLEVLNRERAKREALLRPVTTNVQGTRYTADAATRAKAEEELKVINANLGSVYALYPEVRGKAFKSSYDKKKGNVEEALKSQLLATRAELKKNMAEFRDATKCLNTHKTYGACTEFDKTLSKTPPFRVLDLTDDHDQRSENIDINGVMGLVECHQGIRQANDQMEDAITDAAIGLGLTAATMGLGSVAAGAKAAMTAAQLSRGGASAAQVAQLTQRAQMAKTLITGLNVAAGGRQAAGAAEVCDDKVNQLVGGETQFGAGQISNICQTLKQSSSGELAQLRAEYSDCVMASLGAGLQIALPLAPAVARHLSRGKLATPGVPSQAQSYFTSEQRVLYAREVLKRDLNEAQKNAILKAHDLPNQTSIDKLAKARVLKEAGFSEEERRLLMESWTTGNNSRVVQLRPIMNVRPADVSKMPSSSRLTSTANRLQAHRNHQLHWDRKDRIFLGRRKLARPGAEPGPEDIAGLWNSELHPGEVQFKLNGVIKDLRGRTYADVPGRPTQLNAAALHSHGQQVKTIQQANSATQSAYQSAATTLDKVGATYRQAAANGNYAIDNANKTVVLWKNKITGKSAVGDALRQNGKVTADASGISIEAADSVTYSISGVAVRRAGSEIVVTSTADRRVFEFALTDPKLKGAVSNWLNSNSKSVSQMSPQQLAQRRNEIMDFVEREIRPAIIARAESVSASVSRSTGNYARAATAAEQLGADLRDAAQKGVTVDPQSLQFRLNEVNMITVQ